MSGKSRSIYERLGLPDEPAPVFDYNKSVFDQDNWQDQSSYKPPTPPRDLTPDRDIELPAIIIMPQHSRTLVDADQNAPASVDEEEAQEDELMEDEDVVKALTPKKSGKKSSKKQKAGDREEIGEIDELADEEEENIDPKSKPKKRKKAVNTDNNNNTLASASGPNTRKKRATARKTQERMVEEENDNDTNNDEPISKKPKKAAGTAKASKPTASDLEAAKKLTFQVPTLGGFNKRLLVPTDCDYEDVLDMIHEVVGCSEIQKKPQLEYKMGGPRTKADPVEFGSQHDWEILVKDSTGSKKVLPNFYIQLFPSNYIDSLRQHLESVNKPSGKTKASSTNLFVRSTTGKSKNSKKKEKEELKLPLMKFDGSSNMDDGPDIKSNSAERVDDDLDDKEVMRAVYKELRGHLAKCARCGKEESCKIDRNAQHVNPTHNQLWTWSSAIFHKQPGVTLDTPPKTDMFSAFYPQTRDHICSRSNSSHASINSAPAPSTPVTNVRHMMEAFTPLITALAGCQHASSVSPPSVPSRAAVAALSSSLVSPSTIVHTELDVFLRNLHEHHPKRSLDLLIDRFTNNGFYSVYELSSLKPKDLTGSLYDMKLGNTPFLLQQAKDKVEHCKQLNNVQ
ncbi:hypothetical protein V5O48_007185 [Marasmius crinis-equi]|uniref:Uncharacterized protein n=1 Tax=Marasmius crinis-equi TaxID=585013 RepID=A0ABR3FHD1_9AGAR